MQCKIAIFNGFPFHYEMFGTVLEYLTTHKIPFDIFSETKNEMGWISVYESYFGKLTFRNLHEYNHDTYDYVFLLTDDDYRFKYRGTGGAKIIMFEHSRDRTVPLNAHRRIQLRQYNESNAESWCLPVWNIRSFPRDPAKLKVVAIGNNCPSNPDELKPYFYDINAIDFVFMNRYPAPTKFDHTSWSEYPNVKLKENVGADEMLNHAATADWLMILPKNENQYKTLISAIHPIAYGAGVPILMKKEWISAYNWGGIQPFDNTVSLPKPSDEIIDELNKTRNMLFARRDTILTESLM